MYNKKIKVLLLASCSLLMVSCAKTKVEHFRMSMNKEIKAEKKNDGIRYYENAPYILVYSGQGSYTSKFLWLPDTSSISSATPSEFLATNTLNMDLTNGVLTTGQTKGDSTKIPSAMIALAKDLALAAAKAAAAANVIGSAPTKQTVTEPKLYLYRIDMREDGTPVLYGDSLPIKLVE